MEKKKRNNIYAICGLSIGAQIAVEVLTQKCNFIQFAVIESALLIPMQFGKSLIAPTIYLSYPFIKFRWFSNLQAKYLFVPENKLDLYYEDSCKMSKESLINMTKSNMAYDLSPKIKEVKTRILI